MIRLFHFDEALRMRLLRLLPIFLSVSTQTFAVEPDGNKILADSARTLNFRSRESLGIGIAQIGLLLQAGPYDIFRKDTLQQNGSWPLVKELESKGFVTIRETTMPGDSMGGQAVVFSLTPKGQAIVTALKGK